MKASHEEEHDYLSGACLGFQLALGILLRFLPPDQRIAFVEEAEKAIRKATVDPFVNEKLSKAAVDGIVMTLTNLIEEAERTETEWMGIRLPL